MLVSKIKSVTKKISYKYIHIVCWPTTIVATFNLCLTFGGYTTPWEKKKKIYFAFSTFSKFKFLKPNPVAKILLLRDLAVKIEKKGQTKFCHRAQKERYFNVV